LLKILELNPQLRDFEGDINERLRHYQAREKELCGKEKDLTDFANGAHYFGLHRKGKGWVYREWAPGAEQMHLTGDFNGWNRTSHPMKRLDNGNWEIELDENSGLKHLGKYKVCVTTPDGVHDRIPLYARYVTEDASHNFSATVWAPEQAFEWTDADFQPRRNVPPIIYEAHVGMATEEQKVGTYREFTESVLERIKADGYNTVQLMAIMEHPYYGSFGYQVSNFYAASSRYGTPDELKALINRAHELGLSVLLDVVHSHAVKNELEGISRFDGRDDQFFKEGGAGYHPAWDSRVFDYGKNGVVHFLLSNIRFWMEEYHFDGFRFDGVTSMLYLDQGLGTNFASNNQYFSMNTDVEAVCYLQMATHVAHTFKKGSICIAEDMSAMPGMCLPIEDGGLGFDYRLSMGLPDFFIKTIKEREDGHWPISRLYWELCARRPEEKNVAYAESHDQALVGDQTIMFRLAGDQMYWGMRTCDQNITVERAMALHKMIRLVTIGAGGEGYLNFMGNEFGHPEWIDFPREGNGWSYLYARRQWSLADNPELRYGLLGAFDKAMIQLIRNTHLLSAGGSWSLRQHEDDQILCYQRGDCVFVFNFHPFRSQEALFVPVSWEGDCKVVLSTDEKRFGGYGNIDMKVIYHTWQHDDQLGNGFTMYLPARTAAVLRRCDPKGHVFPAKRKK